MTGPTVGFPSLPDVQLAVDEGDLDSGDVVWVTDIQEFVRVYLTDAAEPVVIRNRYPSVPDYEGDVEEEYIPPWTPGVIIAEGIPYTPVLESECTGGIVVLGHAYPLISTPSSGSVYVVGAAASDTDMTVDAPSVPTSTDPA